MFCNKCGKEMPEGVTVCENCSSSNPPSPPQQPEFPFQQPPISRPMYIDPDSVQTTNGLAIASLVVSIVGLFMGIGIVGLILGIIANNQIKASNGRQKGSGLAIAGIAVGCVSLILPIIMIAGMFSAGMPVFNRARMSASRTSCLSNLKQLSLGVMMYMQDYDQHMPPATKWTDGLQPYIKNNNVFVCPEATSLTCGYSLYEALDGVSLKKIAKPSDTPMLFDSNGGWNSALPIDKVVFRHNGGYNCGFVDGHVKYMGPSGGSSPGSSPYGP